MVVTRGKRDTSPSLQTDLGNRDAGLSLEFTQISPSQLPKLLASLHAEDKDRERYRDDNGNASHANDDGDDSVLGIAGGALNDRVVYELQQLLCCPMCHAPLLDNPVVVDPCGHAFCYACINIGLEKGCFPVEKMEGKASHHHNGWDDSTDREYHHTAECKRYKADKPIEKLRGRQQRRRKVQFTCPVCLGPAHKWNLVRVPLIREVVLEALRYTALSSAFQDDKEDECNTPCAVKKEIVSSCTATPVQTRSEGQSQSTGPLTTAVEFAEECTLKDSDRVIRRLDSSSFSSPLSVRGIRVSASISSLNSASAPQVPSHSRSTGKDVVEEDIPCGPEHGLDDCIIDAQCEEDVGQRQYYHEKSNRENVEFLHEWMSTTGNTYMKSDSTERAGGAMGVEITSGLNSQHPGLSIPSFVLDASLPCTSGMRDILLSALRLFGVSVIDERRTSENSLSSASHALLQPMSTFTHPIQSHSLHELTPERLNTLYWKELQYNAEPLTGTHCLVTSSSSSNSARTPTTTHVSSTASEEMLVSTMTPSIASALVSTSLVLNWEWLKECVMTRQLLSTSPYIIGGSLYARWNTPHNGDQVRNCKTGEWMKDGYGFIVLPDALFLQLVSHGTNTVNPSTNISIRTRSRKEATCGEDSLLAWRRLILLGGGVHLQLTYGCLESLVAYTLASETEMRESRLASTTAFHTDPPLEAIREEVRGAVQHVLHQDLCLWAAEVCPDRQTTICTTVQRVILLHGPIPSVWPSVELQQRLLRLRCALQVLLTLPSAVLNPEGGCGCISTGVSARLQWLGHTNQRDIAYPVELRSTTWLLRNLLERRQGVGAPPRWYYGDGSRGNNNNSNSSNPEEDGVLSRRLLYEHK